MTPQQLLDAAQALCRRAPDAELVKNQVGNLSVMIDDEYRGIVDLKTGEVEFFADTAEGAGAGYDAQCG